MMAALACDPGKAATTMMLVLGQSGQLARELAAMEALQGAVFADRTRIDMAQPSLVGQAILDLAPSAVINATAYTAVDRAETEEAAALAINALGVEAAARACAALDVPFVHVSTDYVFAGDGHTPYAETDPIAPANAYGRTKAEGEQRVLELGSRAAIIRTSWVYSRHGTNFVKTMLKLAGERDSVSVVDDQRGRPTHAADLAQACVFASTLLADGADAAGIYHYANEGVATWADLAEEVFHQHERLTGKPTALVRIGSDAYPTPAKRPAWSVLGTQRIEAAGLAIPPWRPRVAAVVSELIAERG